MVNSLQWTDHANVSHVTPKLGQISKIWPEQIVILCPRLRINAQLPAPIVNGRGDNFLKWPDCQL